MEKMGNFPLIGISGTKGGLNLGNRKGYLTSHKKIWCLELTLVHEVNTPPPSLCGKFNFVELLNKNPGYQSII